MDFAEKGWASQTTAKRKSHVPIPSITSLIYVSTARPGLEHHDLLAIMSVAQSNNQRSGITGLILFNGFNFMQCIEGERAAAHDCLRRIERDDRHSGMTIISQREMPARQFNQWRMVGPSLPAQSDFADTDLSSLLYHQAVTEATRTQFESFLSFGFGKSV